MSRHPRPPLRFALLPPAILEVPTLERMSPGTWSQGTRSLTQARDHSNYISCVVLSPEAGGVTERDVPSCLRRPRLMADLETPRLTID
jgi:hypothetical protein